MLTSAASRLATDRRSVASLEFAAMALFWTPLLAGGYDAAQALVLYEQVNTSAQAVVEAAEKASVQGDGTFSLNETTAMQAMSTVFAQMPGVPSKNNIPSDLGYYSVTLSSVVMTPTGCTITNTQQPCTPVTAWSATIDASKPGTWDTGNTWQRLCGSGSLQQSPSFNGPKVSPMGRPYPLAVVPIQNVTMQAAMLIADVQYQFSPTFFQSITGPINIWASAAFPVPGGDLATAYVQFLPATDQNVTICPGYT